MRQKKIIKKTLIYFKNNATYSDIRCREYIVNKRDWPLSYCFPQIMDVNDVINYVNTRRDDFAIHMFAANIIAVILN